MVVVYYVISIRADKKQVFSIRNIYRAYHCTTYLPKDIENYIYISLRFFRINLKSCLL